MINLSGSPIYENFTDPTYDNQYDNQEIIPSPSEDCFNYRDKKYCNTNPNQPTYTTPSPEPMNYTNQSSYTTPSTYSTEDDNYTPPSTDPNVEYESDTNEPTNTTPSTSLEAGAEAYDGAEAAAAAAAEAYDGAEAEVGEGAGEGAEEEEEEETEAEAAAATDTDTDTDEEAEEFTGSMDIEHFSGSNIKEKVLSLNLLLKSVLFACLFYIIAHPDTKVFLLQNIKCLKSADFLMVSMVLFFICYYILNIFV